MRASVRALVLRPWFFDDVKQENPRPTARGLYNSFCLPLAVGAALGFFAGAGRAVRRLLLERGCERWLALALRPRAALVLVWASLSRRRSPFWGEKGFFSGTDARGRVLRSVVGDWDV